MCFSYKFVQTHLLNLLNDPIIPSYFPLHDQEFKSFYSLFRNKPWIDCGRQYLRLHPDEVDTVVLLVISKIILCKLTKIKTGFHPAPTQHHEVGFFQVPPGIIF